MPKRLRNQHIAKRRKKQRRELLSRPGIRRGRIRKNQVSMQSVSSTTAIKEPSNQVQQKTYKLVLAKGPENESERASWIASIVKVFGKTEAVARNIIFHAEYYDEKPILSSGNMDEIAGLRNRLLWSLRDATKIKE